MAEIGFIIPKILAWEGGFVCDPVDKGGATNMGVTIDTYRTVFGKDKTVEDLKTLTIPEFTMVLKRYYWDLWKADEIKNQSVAEILVDWVWGSGDWGIIIPQRILKVKQDGLVGRITISALNNQDQEVFHEKVKQARYTFINGIIKKDPSQEKFHKGWNNRIASYEFIN